MEADSGVSWLGDYAKEFMNLCDDLGIDCSNFYYTSAVKHGMFVKKSTLPKTWIEWSRPLLEAEISLVNPKIIILLGAKALKVACGNQAKMSDYQGRIFEVSAGPFKGKTLISCTDPSSIIYKPENRVQVKLDLSTAAQALNVRTGHTAHIETDYGYIFTLEALEFEVDRILSTYSGWLAVDCEWSGQNHLNGYLRTIQLSWFEGVADVIVFSNEKDEPTELSNNLEKTWKLIKKLLENSKTRLIGHFIRADLPWLIHAKCDSLDLQVMQGWDTALAGHLLNENWKQSLETYTLRYTDMGRYDFDVKAYIKANKAEIEVDGFKYVPDNIFLSYAAADADATFRIFCKQYEEMNAPEMADIKKLFRSVVMPATMPILEMEMSGMLVDQNRMIYLAKAYSTKRQEVKQYLATELNWPDYNPDSPDQKVEALFNVGKRASDGSVVFKSPEGVQLKQYTPVKRTDDGKAWDAVISQGLLDESRPSTDRSTLQTLLIHHPDDEFVKNCMYYSAISQAVKTFTGEYTLEGGADIKKGILSKMWADGKVHCRIRQTVETGRYGHSNPNMAQIPKSAESLLSKVFTNNENIPSIRSCFIAEPGWCFIDADWVGAELFVMAWCSGDTAMQERLTTPGVDFHSETAITMFQLELPPNDWTTGTKDWIAHNNNNHLRTIAKAITFGIAYGRGAAAIKEEVYRQGINISVEDAQDAINKFKATYPRLTEWLNSQKALVTSQGYVCNAFGRRRRFDQTNEPEVLAHQERQAMNMPIQGTVGDLMSLALVNLFTNRQFRNQSDSKNSLNFKILMSVHDQILITCPIDEVEDTLRVMRDAMCTQCKAPDLDIPLQIDMDLSLRWGEILTDEEIVKIGLDPASLTLNVDEIASTGKSQK
jgi:DNA polymerase-1